MTLISEASVLRASFVRSALECACIRDAALKRSEADLAELEQLLQDQSAAVTAMDHGRFHGLDNELHRRICEISGHGYTWPLIQDQKAHIDRVRFLALSFERQTAHDQHRHIVDALADQDPDKAVTCLRTHLGRIPTLVPLVRNDHPQFFEDSPE